MINRLRTVFSRNGYQVQQPIFIHSPNPSVRCSQLTMHSILGAGGFQDAYIELTGDGVCRVFVGQPYSAGSPTRPAESKTVPWKRAELPADIPDLDLALLKQVRRMLLED